MFIWLLKPRIPGKTHEMYLCASNMHTPMCAYSYSVIIMQGACVSVIMWSDSLVLVTLFKHDRIILWTKLKMIFTELTANTYDSLSTSTTMHGILSSFCYCSHNYIVYLNSTA